MWAVDSHMRKGSEKDPSRSRGSSLPISSARKWLERHERQPDREDRPTLRRALERDRPAHRLDQLARDPKAQPDAAIVPVPHRALEAAEDPLMVLARDADAEVAHDQQERRPLARRRDAHRP